MQIEDREEQVQFEVPEGRILEWNLTPGDGRGVQVPFAICLKT